MIRNIVLASTSPRRKEILEKIGLKFTIIPSSFEENLDSSKMTIQDFVINTAKGKSVDVFNKLDKKPDLLISCDTMIVVDSQVLGKPKDEEDAFRILRYLSSYSNFLLYIIL